jgi:hypothetical protein
MSENKKVINETNAKAEATTQETTNYTIDYILKMLEKISNDQAHISTALEKLSKLESKGPFGADTAELADSIAHVVDSREETNRKLISLYEKMYDDLKAKQPMNEEKFNLFSLAIGNLSESLTPIETKEALAEALQIIANS